MRRVSAAEPADGVVERLGLLEVADVTGAGDDDELRVRDPLLELACDAERRARVGLSPDQQVRHGDVRQQIAVVGLGHHKQRGPHAVGAHGCGHLSEERQELGRRISRDQPGGAGSNSSAGGERLSHALDPRAHLSSGSDPFQPA